MTIDTATSPFRFAIAATFTAEPLRPVIAFWSKQLNANFEIRFAPYNQLAQTLLDPASELGSNAHGMNIVLARLEDLGQFDTNSTDELVKLEANVRALLQQIRDSAPALSAPVIVCLCPSSPAFLDTPQRHAFKKRMMSVLSAGLDETPGVQLLHYEQIERWYPVDVLHDAEGERLGKIPYTELYYCALGTALVRCTHALRMEPFKVVALDCDNTLWDGICGEDGPEGVVVDPPRRRLQEFMVEQREAGMLLTMASKNNEQDVLDTFAAHPQMPLSLRHFTAWRWNWEPKAENLRSLAEELALSLDSFIFIDDNPKECAELSGELPEVLSLALPADIERTPGFLDHVLGVRSSRRHRRRPQSECLLLPAAGVRRGGWLAASPEQFMDTLDLRVAIPATRSRKACARRAIDTAHESVQLLTTIRRTEPEIQALDDGYECIRPMSAIASAIYGLTGVVIFKAERGRALRRHLPAKLPRARPRRRASDRSVSRRDRQGPGSVSRRAPVPHYPEEFTRSRLPGKYRLRGTGTRPRWVYRLSAPRAVGGIAMDGSENDG